MLLFSFRDLTLEWSCITKSWRQCWNRYFISFFLGCWILFCQFLQKSFRYQFFHYSTKKHFQNTIKHRTRNPIKISKCGQSEIPHWPLLLFRKRNGCRSKISGVYLNQINKAIWLTASCCLHWLLWLILYCFNWLNHCWADLSFIPANSSMTPRSTHHCSPVLWRWSWQHMEVRPVIIL